MPRTNIAVSNAKVFILGKVNVSHALVLPIQDCANNAEDTSSQRESASLARWPRPIIALYNVQIISSKRAHARTADKLLIN